MRSLKDFLLRIEVLDLYKSFIKSSMKIGNRQERKELQSWISQGLKS